MRFQGLILGIPKEIMPGEGRVAGTPDTVEKMVAQGARVLVEAGGGEGSYYGDKEYAEAGADLTDDVEKLFEMSDVILKVKEPRFSNVRGGHEIEMMKKGQCLVAFLHPASPANHEMVRALASRGVIAFSLDSIPRISRAQPMDALTSMSTVAGYKAVLGAADMLATFMPPISVAAGLIEPANVLVVGTGVAGLQALATAKRLGAEVWAADIRPDACEQAQSLGASIVDTGVPVDVAVGGGGYARTLPDTWLCRERQALKEYVAQADIVILAALVPGKMSPVLVTEEMVESMRPGSVIVDIAIDQGGNCESTVAGQIIDKNGVKINGVENIPGSVSRAATRMFANNMYEFLACLIRDGKVDVNMEDEIIASSLVTKDGNVVHAGALEAMGMK